MKKILIALLVCMCATSFALTPSAYNRRTTFDNQYQWTGNARDNATLWAQQVEGAIEAGQQLGTGSIFYVDSGVLSEGDGSSWTNARDTLDEAIGLCTANRGDFIMVAQGHAENLSAADAVDADVAGITIIGVGNGSLQPTFTYTAAAGEFVIGADNVAVTNLRFVVSTDTVTVAVDVESGVDYAVIDSCVFKADAATDEAVDYIILATTNVGCVIQNCTFDAKTGSADSAIKLDNVTDQTVIRNNLIQGDYAVACIEGDSALSTELLIQGNLLVNGSSDSIIAQPAIDLLTGTTGYVVDNYLVCNVATVAAAMETADTVMLFNNWYNEDAGASKAGSPWHVGTFGGTLMNSVSASGDG
jgi:hypothetical protein